MTQAETTSKSLPVGFWALAFALALAPPAALNSFAGESSGIICLEPFLNTDIFSFAGEKAELLKRASSIHKTINSVANYSYYRQNMQLTGDVRLNLGNPQKPQFDGIDSIFRSDAPSIEKFIERFLPLQIARYVAREKKLPLSLIFIARSEKYELEFKGMHRHGGQTVPYPIVGDTTLIGIPNQILIENYNKTEESHPFECFDCILPVPDDNAVFLEADVYHALPRSLFLKVRPERLTLYLFLGAY